jgi:glycosyltransferase involved in cell wall biosynthesis
VSDDIAVEMRSVGADEGRITVVRNGVDTDRFAPLPAATRAELRRGHGWTDDDLITVFVGRVVDEKRVDLLIDSWRNAHRRLARPGTLVVAGEGDRRAELESATAGENVEWWGIVDDPAELLACADVFVLPSIAEGLSNALLEAASTGLGIVVTDVGGAREVVIDGASGIIVPPDDVRSLCDGLTSLLGDPELRGRLGAEARLGVIDSFGADRVAHRFADIYRGLAGRPAARRPLGGVAA